MKRFGFDLLRKYNQQVRITCESKAGSGHIKDVPGNHIILKTPINNIVDHGDTRWVVSSLCLVEAAEEAVTHVTITRLTFIAIVLVTDHLERLEAVHVKLCSVVKSRG